MQVVQTMCDLDGVSVRRIFFFNPLLTHTKCMALTANLESIEVMIVAHMTLGLLLDAA